MINHLCFTKPEIPLSDCQKSVLAASAIVSLAIAVISALVLSSLYVPSLNPISQVFSFMATVEGASVGIVLGMTLCSISLVPVFLRACGRLPPPSTVQQNGGEATDGVVAPQIDPEPVVLNEAAIPDNQAPVLEEIPRVLSRKEVLESMALGFPEQSIFKYPPAPVSPLEEVREIIQNIASFLPGSDIISLQVASKRCCNALRQKHFWTRLQTRYGLQLPEDLDIKVIKACLLVRCGAAFRRVANRIIPSDANDSNSKTRLSPDFGSIKWTRSYIDSGFRDTFKGEKFDGFHPLNHELVLLSKDEDVSEIGSLSGDLRIKLQDPDRLPNYLFGSTGDKLIGMAFARNSEILIDDLLRAASLKIWNFDGTLSQSCNIFLPRDQYFVSITAHRNCIILISIDGDIISVDPQDLSGQIVYVEKYRSTDLCMDLEVPGRRIDLMGEKYPSGVIWKQFLIAGSNDGKIYVWNLDTNTNCRSLSSHSRCVTGLSLRGNILVSGSLDGTVKIWDLVTMKYCGTILSEKGCIYAFGIFENTVCIVNGRNISFFDFTPQELL